MKEVQPKGLPSSKPTHLKVQVDREGRWEDKVRGHKGEEQISLISLLLLAK